MNNGYLLLATIKSLSIRMAYKHIAATQYFVLPHMHQYVHKCESFIHRLREHIPPNERLYYTLYTTIHGIVFSFFFFFLCEYNMLYERWMNCCYICYPLVVQNVYLDLIVSCIVNSWIFLYVSFGSLFLVESISVYACAKK